VFDDLSALVALLVAVIGIVIVGQGIRVVPQSMVYVVERFGKYTRTLTAGLNFIVPLLDRVQHRVSILERQLPAFKISVITRDNVEVELEATVFYRIVDAASSVYRIQNVDSAIDTAATSIVRSAAGKLDLDDLQSSRESMNQEIAANLAKAAEVWGIEITRTEITDVRVDEQTKDAQRQQLNAERQRRAEIMRAEGAKRAIELEADAQLYAAEKQADAVRIKADADAYAVEVAARADAEQTRQLARAIAEDGQGAVAFEIMKRQVAALGALAASPNSKTIVVPTNVTGVLGAVQTLLDTVERKGG
jgi:regulator of protease activity HflC (stomatin/prohibitin superfamily)